jgi:protein crumbs
MCLQVNTTAANRFVVESRQDVSMEGCVLCYEQECENGGVCQNPGEVFQCQCPDGFEDEVCSTNIDECVSHRCVNGFCQDGIANYTCTCLPGWTGWL